MFSSGLLESGTDTLLFLDKSADPRILATLLLHNKQPQNFISQLTVLGLDQAHGEDPHLGLLCNCSAMRPGLELLQSSLGPDAPSCDWQPTSTDSSASLVGWSACMCLLLVSDTGRSNFQVKLYLDLAQCQFHLFC